jgi:3-oxoacyl-[acyl-carrier-protein] synthase I
VTHGRRVYVVALGATTPIGRDAWSSAAAVRAGISGFNQHPFMIDGAGEPMRAAFAPWLDIDLTGPERFETLVFPAIDQALTPLADRATRTPRLAVSLALPLSRPGLPSSLGPALSSGITRRYGGMFAAVAQVPKGHAAGIVGLDAALIKLKDGTCDACIVAGVDSYLEPETLEWLEANDQLHGAGPLNNAWGFIPGEAAGAVLLMGDEAMNQLGCEPLAELVSIGHGLEHNRIKTETVCIGEGLTQAFQNALMALPSQAKVTDIYCDMNGEPYRADEFGFATVRTASGFVEAGDFEAPADCWGDVGAASGPLFVSLAAVAHEKGYAKGSITMAWASSESGERSAALLQFESRQ